MRKGSGKILAAIFALAAAFLTIGFFAKHAGADISNPHPTPPSNSVTTAMIQNAAITPSKLDATQGYTTASSTNYNHTVGVLNATSSATLPAATTIAGLSYTWPSVRGIVNTVPTENGSGTLTWAVPKPLTIYQSYTAVGNVSTGTPVSMVTGQQFSTSTIAGNGLFTAQQTTPYYWAEEATTTATSTQVTGLQVQAFYPGGTLHVPQGTLSLRADNAGVPASTDLGSCGLSNGGSSITNASFTGSCQVTPITVTPSTRYWVVYFQNDGFSGYEDQKSSDTTHGFAYESSNGSSWTLQAYAVNAQWSESTGLVYGVAASSAAANNTLFTNFIGMTEGSAVFGGTVAVDVTGFTTSTTTLATSTQYFLSNTAGLLSTSAGSNSKVVGVATGYNTLLLQP